MMEIRFTEPPFDPGGDGTSFLGGSVGGGQGLGARGERVERRAADGLAGLDDDDGRLGARRDGFGERPEEVRIGAVAAGYRRGPHDDEVGLLGLAQDRVADVGRLPEGGLALAAQVLLDERRQRPFRLRADGHRDAGRHEVEDDDRRPMVLGDGVGEADGELGVRTAADRHEHALDVARSTLLHDRDIGRRFADDLVDGRGEDGRAVVAAVLASRGLAAPAEDDEVRFLLGRGLDDAFGGVPADAHDRVDRRPLGHVVEDLLEQAPCVPGAGGALGQRHAFGHFHDAQRRQLALARIEHRGTEPDELLGRARVRDRDEDADRER